MPPDWEEDFWNELSNDPSHGKQNQLNKSNGAPSITLRPPLYNAEDYTTALKQHFSSHSSSHKLQHNKPSVIIEHSSSSPQNGFYEKNVVVAASHNGGGGSGGGGGHHLHSKSSPTYLDHLLPETPPEMSMRKFLNGSELLFKLEADLRHAFPTFVQEFLEYQGVAYLLETLKIIQAAIDSVTGLREQRKLFMDELKCLHCIRLCLRNIEAVSKLAIYPGGLYPLASAMISTVTTTRIIALEILTCVCSEGGPDGHFKVSEAISTLRLRMGEPIRCKLLIGAISSAPPGTFQAKGIKFITTWVSSASSPKQKVHIQCELEEAGFSPQSLRKGAELGGARESREVQAELDAWANVAIDVDTLTRQNGQLRNSVATLQQEVATLKDKIKKMDIPNESKKRSPATATHPTNNLSLTKPRAAELVTTPVDSEEEAEQIHQILEDLNNIVNSEMNQQPNIVKKPSPPSKTKKEKEIVPANLVKAPPPKKLSLTSSTSPSNKNKSNVVPSSAPRPWATSSASEDCYADDDDERDDDSDEPIQPVRSKSTKANISNGELKPKNVVRQVVEQIEQQQAENSNSIMPVGNNGKLYQKHNGGSPKSKSPTNNNPPEPKPDYYNALPNFHKQNHMASKFVNFKSSKLYSSSPDNSLITLVNSNHHQNNKSHAQLPVRISPTLEKVQKAKQQLKDGNGAVKNGHGQLRRSESLHTSLTSIIFPRKHSEELVRMSKGDQKLMKWNKMQVEKWKSVDNLIHDSNGIPYEDSGEDQKSNFTLRWRYPSQQVKSYPSLVNTSPKSDEKVKKSSKVKSGGKSSPTSGKAGGDKKSLSSTQLNVENSMKGNNNNPHSGVFELYTDYRQSRFTTTANNNNSPKQSSKSPTNQSNGGGGGLGFFSRYSKKSSNSNNTNSNNNGINTSSGGSNSSGNSAGLLHSQNHDINNKKKKKSTKQSNHCLSIDPNINESHNYNQHHGGAKEQNLTMFSLPPIFVSQGIEHVNHRICDLPSGLY